MITEGFGIVKKCTVCRPLQRVMRGRQLLPGFVNVGVSCEQCPQKGQ